eukprot:1516442-Rhodomonas_salina.1
MLGLQPQGREHGEECEREHLLGAPQLLERHAARRPRLGQAVHVPPCHCDVCPVGRLARDHMCVPLRLDHDRPGPVPLLGDHLEVRAGEKSLLL